MRLGSIVVGGFRNLSGSINFPGPLTLLAGENNAGKSNVIDALRLLTQPSGGPRFSRWITADDFTHDGTGKRLTDTFELEAVFVELSDVERARMLTCLAPSRGDGVARMRLRAQLTATGRVEVAWYGGDSEQQAVEPWARQAIIHTYMHPLRDAAADLRPGRDNRLVHLLAALAPPDSPERSQIEEAATQANERLAAVVAVDRAKTELQDRLRSMAGSLFAQRSDLVFADARFDRVVATLRALAGDQSPLELSQNGLGFNNLLYMATLLAAIDVASEDGLHLLLVEEPEAHLHPQLQDLLLRFLQREAGVRTQVVVTTHSPNFAAASGVESMTVLSRGTGGGASVSRTPATFAMSQLTLDHLRRFLDVTKASLLFARAVILVEGVSEQLLLPIIARQLNLPLNDAGVAVVNVGGLSFGPFADLFAEDRLSYRCAVVSDGDPPTRGLDEEDLEGGEPNLSTTARKLKDRENENLRVFLSQRTLEWDLALCGNWDLLIEALALIKPRVATRIAAECADVGPETRAAALLGAVDNVKGRYAQALAQLLAAGAIVAVPTYLAEAVEWAVAGNSATTPPT